MKKKWLFIILCIIGITVSATSCGYYEDNNSVNPAITTGTTVTTSNKPKTPTILANGKCGDNAKWNIDNTGLLTISGTGKMYDYDDNHPSPFNGGRVLNGKYTIQKIVIQSGITSIGNWSLCYFYQRQVSITMPNTIKSIGKYAFYQSAIIGSGKIPNGVTSIGDYAFYYSYYGITIPGTVKTIGNGAFYGCSQDSIVIPKSVTSIGENVFSIRKRIDVESGNKCYSSLDGILYNYGKTEMISCPIEITGSVVIPNGVKEIKPNAFNSRWNITSITIPGSVKTIGYSAFHDCFRLKSVIMLDGVKSIDNNSFNMCDSLTSIIIPKSVINFGSEPNHELGFWGNNNLTIYCYKDSKAEEYALKNGLKYACLPTDERLAGSGRYETAAKISQAAFDQAETVVLAYGLNYADALAGVSLATKMNAPILLTNTKSLDPTTLAEIKRLKAKNVIILGGTGAISDEVKKELENNDLTTERIAGASRFGTATAIAEKLNENPTDVFFVYAFNSADALSVSPIAASKNAPIIYLTTKGELNADTATYLAKLKKAGCVKNAYVIGGSGVISDDMMNKAATALGLSKATRIAGANRFTTCVAVNEAFADVLDGDMICVATGMDFPDALAGGVYAARNKAPLFLINGKTKTPKLTDEQKAYLKTKSAGKITAFGGVGVVPDNHIADIAKNSI